MRFFLLIIYTTLSLFAATLNEIKQKQQQMIESLDIDKEEKKTLSQIVEAKFNLRAYKENYFLPFSYRYDSQFIDDEAHGHKSKSTETEFQVSIQYDFATDLFGFGEIYGFGYTQRSWWQVYAKSAFFRETNYQPELFVTIPTYSFLRKTFFKGVKLAFIHESNGRGGEWERSWNRVSFYGYFTLKNMLVELELWYRLHDDIDYNPNLLDYFGYGQLQFIIPYKKHLLKVKFRSNITHHKSALSLIYTYPLPVREKENDLFLFIKTFNGYGESLVDYNQNVNKISIGIAISR